MNFEEEYEQEAYKRDMLGFAIDLAKWLHRGQKDKSGEDYFQHPWRVMNTLAVADAPYTWQAAAVLHDVVEDTTADLNTLHTLGLPMEVLTIVRLLSRNLSEEHWKSPTGYRETGPATKEEFYYARIREHPGALAVKLADIEDNLLDWRLESLDEKTQARLRKKYARALELLHD